MAMVKFDVDTTNKLFVVKAGVTSFDVQTDLYSDAKEHWLAGGTAMGFQFPLRTVAGDPRSDGSTIEPFYFLRDGWKIRPDEADHTLLVTGNIELDEGETGHLFVSTLGGFTVIVTVNTTNRGTLLTASGTADWTAAERAEIRDALGVTGSKSPASGGQLQAKAEPGDPVTLSAAERAALADFIFKRDAASFEVGAAKVSLCTAVLKLAARFSLIPSSGLARIYRTDDITPHVDQPIITDTGLTPVREIGPST